MDASAPQPGKMKPHFYIRAQRAAYIWKLVEGEFRLLHLHCTMARDVPLEGDVNISTKQKADIL